MNQPPLRRFADVRLGEIITGGTGAGGTDDARLSWESRACRLVQEWAGSDSARVMHVAAPSPAATPRDLAARIYARHLDDSRCVTIEVVGRDRRQVCASAVIRVALG
ncbi:MAG: hypothetical protein JWO65_1001 [Sphingomonas bacterium]|jgi:hypothetical protein|nr:hypothetical protein [Sphingomonas bacterium]